MYICILSIKFESLVFGFSIMQYVLYITFFNEFYVHVSMMYLKFFVTMKL